MEIFDYLDKIGTNDLISEVKRRLDGKQPLEFIGTNLDIMVWQRWSANTEYRLDLHLAVDEV